MLVKKVNIYPEDNPFSGPLRNNVFYQKYLRKDDLTFHIRVTPLNCVQNIDKFMFWGETEIREVTCLELNLFEFLTVYRFVIEWNREQSATQILISLLHTLCSLTTIEWK